MRRKIAAAACAAVTAAGVAGVILVRNDPQDDELTPQGAATLWSPPPNAGAPETMPAILVGVRIRVRPGGSSGRLRVRALEDSLDPTAKAALGPHFLLPATPGTYTFPAPRIHWNSKLSSLSLDQRSGHLAITAPCPTIGRDRQGCEEASVRVFQPALKGQTSPRGQAPTRRYPLRELAVQPVLAAG
jgi:hypothetical protein